MWPQQCPVSAPAPWSVAEGNRSPWWGPQITAPSSHHPLFQGHADTWDTVPGWPGCRRLHVSLLPKQVSPHRHPQSSQLTLPCTAHHCSLVQVQAFPCPGCIRTRVGGVGSAGSRPGGAGLTASYQLALG